MQIVRADMACAPQARGSVVVIDVLRSFTTAACALARGAVAVIAVESVDAALRWRQRDASVWTIGALGGGAPAPGLHMGNSPSLLEALELHGRRVVQASAGGTRTLWHCAAADALYAAALVNASATARHLRSERPTRVTLVTTGRWTDRDGDEDEACADLIEALLSGDEPPRAAFEQRVRASDFGRRFAIGSTPHLPRADLDSCARADVFEFAMPVRRCAEGLWVERACTSLPVP